MKKISSIIGVLLLILIIPVLQSCDNDDDGYSLGNFQVQMATVKVINGANYCTWCSTTIRLFGQELQLFRSTKFDGQRVIANITLLGDQYGSYDYVAKINYLNNVLTKSVEELTETNEATFGNDPLRMRQIWLSASHLNVDFLMRMPSQKKHRISLVRNTTAESPSDGYVHLELRYNDQDDVTNYVARGLVSFYVGEWGKADELSNSIRGIKVSKYCGKW
ncbi:MAG: NigD-like C-terminal domain-containing protein [Bacteroides graminisolvens]